MNRIISLLVSLFPVPGRYIGEQKEFSVGDVQATVYWIPDSVLDSLGRATMSNNIWLNERVTDDLPTELVEYLFLHEHGHARRSLAGRLQFYALATLTTVGTLGLALLTMSVAVTALWNPIYSVSQGVAGLLLCLMLTLAAGAAYRHVMRTEELRAELNVVQALGPEEYRRRHQKFEDYRDRGLRAKLRRRLLYPTDDTVIERYENRVSGH